MRKINIKSEEMVELLKSKRDLVEKAQALIDEIETIKIDIQAKLDKIVPLTEKLTGEVSEYEVINEVYVNEEEEGSILVEIADKLEEFKENFKK